MGPWDALLHLANFVAIPLLLGLFAGAATKLAWRRELAQQRWLTLVAHGAAGALAAALGGLVLFGRDGRMATYAVMVGASAITLWWRAFGPGRRRQAPR